MKKLLYFMNEFLKRPLWLLIACAVIVCTHLVLDGTLLRMWHLYNSRKVLDRRIADIQTKNLLVEERLSKLSDSRFLEKEIRDRFNLVGAGDIIFIFSDENEDLLNKNENTIGNEISPK